MEIGPADWLHMAYSDSAKQFSQFDLVLSQGQHNQLYVFSISYAKNGQSEVFGQLIELD